MAIESEFRSSQQPLVVIQPSRGFFHVDLGEVWRHRELLFFLAWRDVKIRYKQTVIGGFWAVIQPTLHMVIFTVVFGNFAKIPSDDLPYPIFAYAALLPWTYFSQAISRSGESLVINQTLVTKVYIPRLIIPFSAVLAPLVDFAIAFTILLGMMAWYGIAPTWAIPAVLLFLLLAVLTVLAVSLWLSALNAKYRDVRYAIPFLVQIWLFASPVVYSVSLVPEKWRLLYSLNPMAGVIEGFRWAMLGKASPDFAVMGISSAVVAVLLCGGILYFKRMERTFADVV